MKLTAACFILASFAFAKAPAHKAPAHHTPVHRKAAPKKPVTVNSYTRKNGKAVKPYTRALPGTKPNK
jgi:hypothetical protein